MYEAMAADATSFSRREAGVSAAAIRARWAGEMIVGSATSRPACTSGAPELYTTAAASGSLSMLALATGESATIHGHASPLPLEDGGLVAVLELEREQPQLSAALLGTLTPREREVAVLVVDGLADREIAERLHLSHHTVSQYVKRIYRRLAVDSRVALTRALLGRR